MTLEAKHVQAGFGGDQCTGRYICSSLSSEHVPYWIANPSLINALLSFRRCQSGLRADSSDPSPRTNEILGVSSVMPDTHCRERWHVG